jgi:hypothetical protein
MAHVRQLRPESGLGFQVKVLEPFKLFPLLSEAAFVTLNHLDEALFSAAHTWIGFGAWDLGFGVDEA